MINCGPKGRNINTVAQAYSYCVLPWFQKQVCYSNAWNSLWFWIVTTIMTFQWFFFFSMIFCYLIIVRFFSMYLECKCWLYWNKMKISIYAAALLQSHGMPYLSCSFYCRCWGTKPWHGICRFICVCWHAHFMVCDFNLFFFYACLTFAWFRITYQNHSCPSHSFSPVIRFHLAICVCKAHKSYTTFLLRLCLCYETWAVS